MAIETTEDVRRTIGAAPRSRARRLIGPLVLLAIVVAVVFGVRRWRARVASQGPTYEMAEVRRGDVQVTVTATGTLQAITTVDVGAEVTGKLLTVKVEPNDPVKKGQLLAQIDPEQLRAAVDQAHAQVMSADASIRVARATLKEATLAAERNKKLREQGLLGQPELESALAAKERAEANLSSATASASLARANLKSAQSRLDKATIVSPIDGLVLSRLVEPGQTVTAGFQTPVLFRLAQDLTQMRLNVDIDEADVGRVREELEASFTVEAYPDETFASKVLSVRNEPKTSQSVVTYQAVLAVDNGDKLLRPGMTCTARIVADTRKDVLIVPNAALRFTPPAAKTGPGAPPAKKTTAELEKKRVWILEPGAPPKPVPIEVKVGASDGIVTEVVAHALKPGTQVLVDVKEPL